MAIQVPWKIRLRGGPKGSLGENAPKKRKNKRGDSASRRDSVVREEDLDHLGRLHKNHR